MTDMTIFPTKDMPSLEEGEALFFTREPVMAEMLAVLCGVSGRPALCAAPRILLCDGGDPNMCAEALRAAPGTPILFYTANPESFSPPPAAVQYRVLGRPFLFEELRCAVADLLKDSPASRLSAAAAAPLRIRVEGSSAVSDEIRIPLTPCEAAILKILTDAYPEAASREQLTGVFARGGGNTVSVYITYLRKKLAPLPAFRGILSLRGGRFALVLHTETKDYETNKGRN